METLPGVVSIPLSDLVYAVIQQTHSHLLSLPQRLVHLRDFDRRAAIRQFVAASRTLLARLLVVVRWAQEQRHLIHACASDVHRIEQQRAQLRSAADEFYFLQNAAPQLGKTGLWQACAPPYDVRAALDIIQRGTYTQLPRCIDLSAERAVPAAREQAAALEWTHRVLRLRRCAWLLPEGVAVRDGRGCVIASVPGEYEIALSAYPPASGPWKVMRLRPWAQHDKHAAAGVGGGVSGRAWRSLWQRMQQLLDEAPEAQRAQPLLTIHAELHARCSQVLLDSLQRQAASLARGAWAGNLRVERVNAGVNAVEAAAGGAGAAGAELPVGAASSGLRLSYLWNPLALNGGISGERTGGGIGPGGGGGGGGGGLGGGGTTGTQQAALLVLPARSHGIILRHEPPLLCLADGASSGAVTRPPSISTSISTSISISEALDAEALVAGAIRERSMRHLKRCAESLDEAAKAAPATSEVEIEGGLVNGSQPRQRQPATAEAPPATATPAAPVGEGMHEGLDEGHTLPMLRFSSGAALALQPRDGAYALLGPHAKPPPRPPGGVEASMLRALQVSAAYASVTRATLALGAPSAALPPPLVRWVASAGTVDKSATIDPRDAQHDAATAPAIAGVPAALEAAAAWQLVWVPLPRLDGWGLLVGLTHAPPSVQLILVQLGSAPTVPASGAVLAARAVPADQAAAAANGAGEPHSLRLAVLAAHSLTKQLEADPFADLVAEQAAASDTEATAAEALGEAPTSAATYSSQRPFTATYSSDALAGLACRLMPTMLALGTARATAEVLFAGAAHAALACERLGGGLELQLAGALAADCCAPLLDGALRRLTDTPTAAPILCPVEGGWMALVPLLPQPPGVASRSRLASGGTALFDARGAALRYAPPTIWSVHDLLCDLQGIAIAHALLRQFEALREAGLLNGVVLCEASCAALTLRTPAGHMLSLDWRVYPYRRACGQVRPPARPVLLHRIRVDGLPLAPVQRQASALLAAGALDEMMRLCDLEVMPPSLGLSRSTGGSLPLEVTPPVSGAAGGGSGGGGGIAHQGEASSVSQSVPGISTTSSSSQVGGSGGGAELIVGGGCGAGGKRKRG